MIRPLLIAIVILVALFSFPAITEQSAPERTHLDCYVGPVAKSYGETQWLVYNCNDRRSLVIVSAPENPAMPFYFMFSPGKDAYRLYGEGNGDKDYTGAAFKELKTLTTQEIIALLEETLPN